MRTTTGNKGGRPMIMSANGMVTSGRYLATGIGLDILQRGGNAMDAAAGVGFALTVLKPHQNGIGGEAPTFWSLHFPSSFYPRAAEPGVLRIECRIRKRVRDELAARGHVVRTAGTWSGGNTLMASIDPRSGVRCAAASPRLHPAWAAGF